MSRAVQYQKGAVIFFEGEYPKFIYILKQGGIEISRVAPDKRTTVYDPVKVGDFFGIENKIVNMPYISRAVATQDSTVVLLSAEEFEALIFKEKNIYMNIIRNICSELKELHAKMYGSSSPQVERNHERGMFHVANGFLYTNEYLPCRDVCTKFLELYPESDHKQKIEEMIEATKRYTLENTGFFHHVLYSDIEDAELFLQESFKRYEKTLPPRKVIFSEFEKGDSVFLVTSGVVRSTKFGKGSNMNLSLARPGEFFGLNHFVDMEVRDVSAITTDEVKLLEFTRDGFEELLLSNPKIAFMFIKSLATKLHIDRRIFRNDFISNLQTRLKDMFAVLDDLGLCEKLEGKARKIYLDSVNISVWTNIPSDEITKELDLLESQGVIHTSNDGWFIVNDIEEARRVSEGIRLVNTKS